MEHVVKAAAVLVLTEGGERVYTKYYSRGAGRRGPLWREGLLTDPGVQADFERALRGRLGKLDVERMREEQVEILSLDGFSVLLTKVRKLQLFLVCESQENEILMEDLLLCLARCFKALLHDSSMASIYRAYADMTVVIDEAIDDGLPATFDSDHILKSMRLQEAEEAPAGGMVSGFFGLARRGLGL
jgi:hypothetical protein